MVRLGIKQMKAKDLLSDPSRWTQRASARDRLGNSCSSLSPRAVKFCIIGAMARAYLPGDGDIEKAERRIREAMVELGWECGEIMALGTWNDDPSRTFDDVKRVLEKADV
jgi:hypothetical protein